MTCINLGSISNNISLFLPALNSTVIGGFGKTMDDYRPENEEGHSLEYIEDLIFWSEKSKFFNYPYYLWSAGVAELDLAKSKITEKVIWKHLKSSTIFVDSGGYQLLKGTLKGFSFNDPDPKTLQILKYQQGIADYAFTFDAPLGMTGQYNEHLKTYEDYRDFTSDRVKFYQQNIDPTSKTKFLLCIHGRTVTEVDDWIESMKFFVNDCHGYALGSDTKNNFALMLYTILKLHEEGMLKGKEVIHLFGVGTALHSSCATFIQRGLQSLGHNIRLTFDNSAPAQSLPSWGDVYINYDALGGTFNGYKDTLKCGLNDLVNFIKNNRYTPWGIASPHLLDINIDEIVRGKLINGETIYKNDGFTDLVFACSNIYVTISMLIEHNYLALQEYEDLVNGSGVGLPLSQSTQATRIPIKYHGLYQRIINAFKASDPLAYVLNNFEDIQELGEGKNKDMDLLKI